MLSLQTINTQYTYLEIQKNEYIYTIAGHFLNLFALFILTTHLTMHVYNCRGQNKKNPKQMFFFFQNQTPCFKFLLIVCIAYTYDIHYVHGWCINATYSDYIESFYFVESLASL